MKFNNDPASGVPFYRQIIDQIKYAIARGELRPGDQLPTVRQLAVELAINPNTVSKSYSQLERQKKLDSLCREFISSAASYGFTLNELIEALRDRKEN